MFRCVEHWASPSNTLRKTHSTVDQATGGLLYEPRAGAPAWLLVAAGTIHAVYSVIYAIWTLFPIGLMGTAQISIFLDGTQGLLEAIFGFLLLAGVPIVQLLGFVVTLLMGLITIAGGLRLNVYRSKGLVWLAVLCSTGAPLLALVINAGSALNIGAFGLGCLTGCLLGNIPTLVTLIVGLIASIFGVVTLFSAVTTERYAQQQ